MQALSTTLIAGAAILALLAGCSEEHFSPEAGYADNGESVTVTGARMASPAPPPPAMDAEPAQASPDQAGQAASYLAYRYSYAVRLPGERLGALHGAHAAACEAAGAARCQIIDSQVRDEGTDRARASLHLRAAPDWVASFREGLAGELDAAGGSIASEQTSVEDLTTRIVDGEARLRARLALRDRLQELLETREADLGDLIQVERELARVQGDIESRESTLAALRQRVTMSELSLSYQPAITPASRSNFAPVAEAFERMGYAFADSLGALILFLAAVLPWLIIIIPGGWLIQRWIRKGVEKRRAKKTAG